MNPDADLLRVVLALQMGFVTKDQVVEAGALWAEDRKKPLTEILAQKGYLKSPAKTALDAMVQAKIEVYGGDPAQSLAASPIDPELQKSLLALPLDDEVKGTLMELKARPPSDAVETVVITKERGERYQPGAEIGRGGLGRVVAARDTVLGREVAIKEMLKGAERPDVLKRFLREGEIAGRLSHPNIIPVLDIGTKDPEGVRAPRPYIVMTRIVGRDLKEIIRAVENDEDAARHDFSRPRLLRVFQDVCLAMAYAHDHGVIHRDLKPANVMVGKYGEVYVVDWGLAKVKGQADPAEAMPKLGIRASESDPRTGAVTLEGDVIGTPAYMPPEQADGRIDEVDERSDIYSLGAILYELVTFRPPFEGTTGVNVIAKVLAGDLTPPTERASEIRKAVSEGRGGEEILFPESIPAELEEIVLKAMARDKTQRFENVLELYDEVQRFLEGEKQRDYNRQMAMAKVAAGKIMVEYMESLRAELEATRKEAEEKGKNIKPHWPAAGKKDHWALEDKTMTLRDDVTKAFVSAQGAFLLALGFEHGNREARGALADLYWGQFLREEQGGNRPEMVLYEALVREYNDGQYDALLKGDGTLAISTRSFPCRCLTAGRMVQPDEMEVMGYHPSSGRALDGHSGAEGLPALEPKEPIRLKVHGAGCKAEALLGTDVWLLKFEERDKIFVPVMPCGVSEGIECGIGSRGENWIKPRKITGQHNLPSEHLDFFGTLKFVLHALYDHDSPFRPKSLLYVGRTPVTKFPLPMGSYLLILHKEGFHPVRCPVFIDRLTDEEVDVTLYRHGEIPEGFVQVPAGKFIYQGDKENRYSGPKEIKDIGDAFIAKFPVTCREYLEFLNDTAAKDPEEAAKRVPRKTPTAGFYWPKDEEGRYHIPTEKWLGEASEDMQKQASKLEMSPIWWDEDWPVFSVSWQDLMVYAAWKTRREDLLFSLPHEIPWEKAARGADGRFYPWGKEFDATFCNSNQSHEEGMHPTPVNSFPIDESPYGVRGLGGNTRDFNLNDLSEAYSGWRLCRGGFWSNSGVLFRSASRTGFATSNAGYGIGGRLSWSSCCRTPG